MSTPDVRTVAVSVIDANPRQPRQAFAAQELTDLASSIKRHGVLQPLVVVALSNGRYQLIAGERRLRAAREAGLKEVPVVVRSADEEQRLELALVENIQRQDLNPLERACGYQQLMERFGLTQEEVARRVGKSRAAVANTLRLLTLPEPVQKAISDGRLTEGHAKVIAGLETRGLQMRFFERVVQTGASVRETEQAAKKLAKRRPAVTLASRRDTDDVATRARRAFEDALGTKVEVTRTPRGSGTITVHFYSEEELGEIVRKILGQ